MAVIAAAVVAAGAVATGARADDARPRIPGGFAAAAFASPTAVLFGDPVTAEVEVLVDPTRVDPDSVRVRTRFTPYTRVGPVQVTRDDAGGAVRLRYRYSLLCLDEICLPGQHEARDIGLGRAVVTGRRRKGSSAVIAPEFPIVRVGPRVSAIDVATSNWRVHDYPLPPVSYRMSPRALAAGLDVVAAVLALLGLALVVRPLVARVPRLWIRDELARLTALERALALLGRARRGGVTTEQRKALDRLARELRRTGDDDLAGGARRLAWSEPPPAPADVDTLTGDVEEAHEVRR